MVRITLDMDDVLADTYGKLVDFALTDFNTYHSREDFYTKSLKELLHPRQYKKLLTRMQQPGFFKDLALKTDAKPVVQNLSNYYELFIVSTAMDFPHSFSEKFTWIQTHFPTFPKKNIVFCGDKSILTTDYLIDNQPHTPIKFTGKHIHFCTPATRTTNTAPRVANWAEIADLFLPAL
ncbi:5' nucleotidase, NT5C type [Arundinibacter roseus]|uniref:5'(3')-deoxyribonucleotidase n=1 Tax=Arundinibacter roseus TaxID=2070510 RepID=A0A4R4KH60_9BACT|nr:5'(3')-deoxyribonucleotidase [Arundinibacter roseus]TDB67143.1 5'(3')-deoxyribonucleotidase [Arundinibacter roseus]